MTIVLYKCGDRKNKLNKELQNPLQIEGYSRNAFEITKPQISLQTNNETQPIDFKNYNYCFIVELNRYYFINAIIIENTNIFTITLQLDVLMSYKQYINKLICLVTNATIANNDDVNIERKMQKQITGTIEVADIFDHTGKLYMATVQGGN